MTYLRLMKSECNEALRKDPGGLLQFSKQADNGIRTYFVINIFFPSRI